MDYQSSLKDREHVAQWKKSQQEAQHLQIMQESINSKKAMLSTAGAYQTKMNVDFQKDSIEQPKINMSNQVKAQNQLKGELLVNTSATKAPTFMLPELSNTSGTNNLKILHEGKPPQPKDEQTPQQQNQISDSQGAVKGYRKSARSISKANETGQSVEIKDTLNFDAKSLQNEVIGQQSQLQQTQASGQKQNKQQNQKAGAVAFNKKTVEFSTDGSFRQQQLILHGLNHQPPHLYQMASPIPFSSTYQSSILNLDRFIGQPPKGALSKGMPQTLQKQMEISQGPKQQNFNMIVGLNCVQQSPVKTTQQPSHVMEQRNSTSVNSNKVQYRNVPNFSQLPSGSQNNTFTIKPC